MHYQKIGVTSFFNALATVRRIWKQYNLKPHLVKTFKLSRDKQFVEKLHDIVGTVC